MIQIFNLSLTPEEKAFADFHLDWLYPQDRYEMAFMLGVLPIPSSQNQNPIPKKSHLKSEIFFEDGEEDLKEQETAPIEPQTTKPSKKTKEEKKVKKEPIEEKESCDEEEGTKGEDEQEKSKPIKGVKKIRKRKCDLKSDWECPQCSKKYTERPSLRLHIKNKHGDTSEELIKMIVLPEWAHQKKGRPK